ncbi:MAG TPA: hypothetical protein VEO20_10470 [Thermoplasmata archaeon]|nr:hypothetical protein [Thermoplasmata archaeon]
MSVRGEAARFGIGLVCAGIAFVGTFAGLALMSLAGLNSGAAFPLWLPFAAGVPTVLVVAFLSLLGRRLKRRFHPLLTGLGIVVGVIVELAFINIFFLYGLLFFPALFGLTAFLVSGYLLDRTSLSSSELELSAAATTAIYGYFASGPILIALGRFGTQGCSDGCGPTENLITAIVVFILALFVFGAAVRSRVSRREPLPSQVQAGL